MSVLWKMTCSLFIAVVCCLPLLLPPAEATGKLEIKLTRIHDTYFKICIDIPGRTGCDLSECSSKDKALLVTHLHPDIFYPKVIQFQTFQEKQFRMTIKDVDGDIFCNKARPLLTKIFYLHPADSEAHATNWTSNRMGGKSGYYFYRLRFKYRAYCDAHYYTSACDVYCRAHNDNVGHYSCDSETGSKVCHPGWDGVMCSTDIDECLQGLCFNGAICTNLPGSYECRCTNGFIGKNCNMISSQCHSSPCQNNGTCTGTLQWYNCTCPPEWTGKNCYIPSAAKATGKLEIKFKSYSSDCKDRLLKEPCDAYFQICIDKPGTVDFSDCYYEYKVTRTYGHVVNFSDIIADIHNPRVFQVQTFQEKRVMLSIKVIYKKGSVEIVDLLSIIIGFSPADSEGHATNWTSGDLFKRSGGYNSRIKFEYRAYCDAHYYTSGCDVYCRAQNDNFRHYSCDTETGSKVCHPGWEGVMCSTDIDECLQGPCFNGAICTNLPGSYECRCTNGFIGKNCDLISSQCHSSPCQNNGTCTGTLQWYSCTCPPEWTGKDCHIPVAFEDVTTEPDGAHVVNFE